MSQMMNADAEAPYKGITARTARAPTSSLSFVPEIESSSEVARHATMNNKTKSSRAGRKKKSRRTMGPMHAPDKIRFVSSCTQYSFRLPNLRSLLVNSIKASS
jgi:hypothetical protein